MQGWRFPGAPRHGIGFGASSTAANPFLNSTELQPDDSWFGDPLAASSMPSQFATLKRTTADTSQSRPATRRRMEDASTHGGAAAVSSSGAVLTQQVPSAALQAGRLSLEGLMPDLDLLPPTEEIVVSEVQRIVSIGKKDYRRVLDLLPSEWKDLQIVQKKYRHLMRLLHPDKRRKDAERRAGGKDRCDLAVRLVQEALAAAKKESPSTSELGESEPSASEPYTVPVDPQSDLKERMRQMQESQRRQARQARMAMQSQSSAANSEAPDVNTLLSDISQVLGESSLSGPVESATPSNPSTTAELINLLAGLRK